MKKLLDLLLVHRFNDADEFQRYRPISGFLNLIFDLIKVSISFVKLVTFGMVGVNWGLDLELWQLGKPIFVEWKDLEKK
jgi:hypothetical protein